MKNNKGALIIDGDRQGEYFPILEGKTVIQMPVKELGSFTRQEYFLQEYILLYKGVPFSRKCWSILNHFKGSEEGYLYFKDQIAEMYVKGMI